MPAERLAISGHFGRGCPKWSVYFYSGAVVDNLKKILPADWYYAGGVTGRKRLCLTCSGFLGFGYGDVQLFDEAVESSSFDIEDFCGGEFATAGNFECLGDKFAFCIV